MRRLCYGLSGVLILGGAACLALLDDLHHSVFIVLVAVVISRVLVLNVAENDWSV